MRLVSVSLGATGLILGFEFLHIIKVLYDNCGENDIMCDACNCDPFLKFMKALSCFTGVMFVLLTIGFITGFIYLVS